MNDRGGPAGSPPAGGLPTQVVRLSSGQYGLACGVLVVLSLAAIAVTALARQFGDPLDWFLVVGWAAITLVLLVLMVSPPRITLSATELTWSAYGRRRTIAWGECGEFRAVTVGMGQVVVAFDIGGRWRPGPFGRAAARRAGADATLGGGTESWRLGARNIDHAELAALLNTYHHAATTSSGG